MNTLLKPPRTSTKYTLCAWRHWLIPKCLVRLACRPSTRRCTLCHWPLCRYLGREAFRRCFFRQCNPCGYGLGSCWFFANWYRFGCRSLRLRLRARKRSRSMNQLTMASCNSLVSRSGIVAVSSGWGFMAVNSETLLLPTRLLQQLPHLLICGA